MPVRFTNAHLKMVHAQEGIIRKKEERNVQAQCFEVDCGSINIEETGWNQNTEGSHYEEMLGESISLATC